MAAALPAIGTLNQKVVASPPPSAPGGGERRLTASPVSVANKLGKSRIHGKRDKEIVHRLHTLRAEQPLLSKPQTCEYRNEYYQQLCIEILEEGFHEAFAEIYLLVERQEETRRQAGPESSIWSLPRLPEQEKQLEFLRDHLSKAESFKREENLEAVYDEQVCLAEYFKNSVQHSHWLAEHFFISSLKTATFKGGLIQARAHRDVGLILEESGNDKESVNHLQNSYSILNESESSESINLKIKVCEDLTRVYTKVGDSYAKEGDLKEQILYLKQAHEKAQESGNETLEGTAAYRLGVAFNKNRQPEQALGYLKSYLNNSESNNDEAAIGEACQELAKSHELSGNVEQAIALLQRRVEVAEKANDDVAIAQSCSALGAIFNSLGRYADAVDYFNKAYTTARAATSSNLDTISSSRVLYGVAAAHKMLLNVQTHVDKASKPALLKLLEWKDQRTDGFANKDD